MRYSEFIDGKAASVSFEPIRYGEIQGALFPFQRALVEWALRRGRAAIFADTGLGKTIMQLEWARHVASGGGRVLILAPLAVAEQTVLEGSRFGIDLAYRTRDHGEPITITNYERLESFDPSVFAGIVLDESSILKSYTAKTRNLIIRSFEKTPYKLACTATPAPNDHTELGNHSEFLGIKSRTEMLAEYFVHDGGSTQNWRLKGHAVSSFWMWVCTWAAIVKRPSDLGFEDGGYDLPPLRMHEHIIKVDHQDAWAAGLLFAPAAATLSDQRAIRRATTAQRVAHAVKIANGSGPALVWCELNAEADAAAKAIPGAVQVKGADTPESKSSRLLGFARGDFRVLVTKPKIAGFGMNWQHCNRMIFVGASHSYEQTYQAMRRCWRFGQQNPVDVHIIRAETEAAIVANFRRKEAAAERMAQEMVSRVRDSMRLEIGGAAREWNSYEPKHIMSVPSWVGEEERTECRTY